MYTYTSPAQKPKIAPKRAPYLHLSEHYIHPTEPYIQAYTVKRALCTPNWALHTPWRALYTPKGFLYTSKRALCTPIRALPKEPYIHPKEPYIHPKKSASIDVSHVRIHSKTKIPWLSVLGLFWVYVGLFWVYGPEWMCLICAYTPKKNPWHIVYQYSFEYI